MQRRNTLAQLGVVGLLVCAGCGSDDVTGVQPLAIDGEKRAWAGAVYDLPQGAMAVQITTIEDPDGMTSLDRVFGDKSLAQIALHASTEFFVEMERRNVNGGMPWRVVIGVYTDQARTKRIAQFVQQSMPPAVIGVGGHRISPPTTDDPGAPVLDDFGVAYSVLGSSGQDGSVFYAWRCELSVHGAGRGGFTGDDT